MGLFGFKFKRENSVVQRSSTITLFEDKNYSENGELFLMLDVKLTLDENDNLIFHGSEAGKMVKSYYGVFDIEYFLSIDRKQVKQIRSILIIDKNATGLGLLDELKKKFYGENCFEDFKIFLTKNEVKFKFDLWR